MTTRARAVADVEELAALYGVEPSYTDGLDRECRPSPEAVFAVLRALGADVNSPDDVPAAIREHDASQPVVDVVIVAWEGAVGIDLSRCDRSRPIACSLTLEDGTTLGWVVKPEDLAEPMRIGRTLPYGYHHLRVDDGKNTHESTIISAPQKAYAPVTALRDWGVFAPLYAVHSKRSWGAGDFSDLRELLCWTGSIGGSVVATLPLLAAFTGRPTSISPYSPASRLFWNEMYIDVADVPDFAHSAAGQETAAADFKADVRTLNDARFVDYAGVTALKRRVLEQLSRSLTPQRRHAFDAFLRTNPRAEAYGRFRAACERQEAGWREWPGRQRLGVLQDGEFDTVVARYHAYVQWIANEQLQALSESADADLYFDLPLGVHPDSYDTWSEYNSFAAGVTAGAPPDAVFTGGQNWGFAPPHPQRARESGHQYFIDSLRHLMRYAGFLRIDHILGLHRLFCIPEGMDGGEGVYVRYPAEELYAILVLESHRNRTVLVGEDLGNVPPYVRPEMARHGILSSYVLPFELAGGKVPDPPGVGQVACLNTHDMQPFARFWRDDDNVKQRAAISAALSAGETNDIDAPQAAANSWLAKSDAAMVLVNLEDLWQETERQNVPGTTEEQRPNWRRKFRHSIEEMREMPVVIQSLADVSAAREYGEVIR